MNILKKISEALSLTKTEVKVYLFLVCVLLLGSGYKLFFKSDKTSKAKNYDYSAEDSLFNQAGIIPETADLTTKSGDNKVDYKEEVLDFNDRNFSENEAKIIPEENSVNLNKAGLEELSRLPGIGIKTAQNIINFRDESGSFKKIEELLEIKGIGQAKLNKLKKYLYID